MHNSKGFTLLEVLIAGFILFLAISTATLVYSSALKSKQNATASLRISGYVPIIQDNIAAEIRSLSDDAATGEGMFMGVRFRWNARVIEQLPIVAVFSAEDRGFVNNNRNAKLWQVTATLQHGSRQSDFAFMVTGWGGQ